MAKRKGGLGKGLSALIPEIKDSYEKNKGDIEKIPLNEIQPNKKQPRKNFDQEKLNALAESIKMHGIIQPIVVRPIEKGYEIVAGERRWKACRQAGIQEVPCIIREMDEKERMEIALIENLQREDLNPIEEALAYKMLMETYQLTQEEISSTIGKSRPYIANTIRLLNLTEEVRDMLIDNLLSSGHARALLRIEDKKMQKEFAQKVIENKLSVRETENMVARIIGQKKDKPKKEKIKDSGLSFIEDLLKERLATKVNIIKGKKKGKIEIEYYSEEDLERLVELLQGN
ncbi:ParB/RepB/Spo0J family partition protein [Crassaminicella thermophila]|uniref:ParB/RepB/Spo0J family partition protein n=1 Tax=Crassaminicella thermophila TaxID=2599308 RepID=A0A5C0SJ99_CRATE|nr:ParB/RepB/Spo0J family partition protein [Crassaminicella thermophila]QEK13524.1 ParB/RepB/Spo0J family partition protein [Crassaminicella thermophila]